MAVVNAGARTLSPDESQEILSLFERHCGSGNPGSQDGNTFYYCKLSTDTIKESKDYSKEIDSKDTPSQVVFVRPPSYEFNHNVALIGSPGKPQDTKIYVLPSTASHNLEFQDQRSGNIEAKKPSLYFLSNRQTNYDGTGSGTNPIGAIVTQRPPQTGYNYNAPAKSFNPRGGYNSGSRNLRSNDYNLRVPAAAASTSVYSSVSRH